MGSFGVKSEQGNYGELAFGCLPGLAPAYRPPPKAGAAGTALSAYRRNPCAGTERTGTKEYFRFLYVGLLQHQRCGKTYPVFRVPAGTEREISASISERI